MNFRKYLVLAGVTVFAPVGDSLLAYGMKQVGNISLHERAAKILHDAAGDNVRDGRTNS